MGKYNLQTLEPVVAISKSYSDVLKHFGLHITGGNHNNIKKSIKKCGIDTSHFGVDLNNNWNKKSPNDILVDNPDATNRTDVRQLRRALAEIGVSYNCVKCGNNGEWMSSIVVLEIDHIDGNWKNNRRENLRYLCPNCHSQTPNYYNKTKQSKCKCGKPKFFTSKVCKDCLPKTLELINLEKIKVKDRPSKELLGKMLWEMPTIKIAKQFGVSDKAVAKWAKAYGINKPPRGYWAKQSSV